MSLVPEVHDELAEAITARSMQRRHWWRAHPLAIVVGGLLVTGTATAAVVAGTDGHVPMSEQKPISTATLRALASPDAVELNQNQRRLVQNDLVGDYELLPQNARAVPSPSTEPGHGGRWVIVPGRRGICVDFGSGAFCTPTSDFEAGRALSTRQPARDIANPDEVRKGAQPRLSATLGPGPGSVRGIVPDDVTDVVARDRTDQQVATARVDHNVYELRLPEYRRMDHLEIRAGTRVRATQRFH